MRKINLLALVAFIASLAWVFTLDRESRGQIQSRVLEWFTPIFKTQTALEGNPEIEADRQREAGVLAAENAELRRELAEARVYRERSDQLQVEVNKLNAMLGFVKQSREHLIPARVINRTASNWWSSVVIDKGGEDGVGTDLPVRNEIGIIGKTAQVSPNSAKVILLTDEQCRVAAQIEGTLEQGIVMGTRGEGDGKGELRMRFLSKDATIPPGLKVISSGAGGLFPAGVFLGTVQEFIEGDVYGEAVVEPAVDLSVVRDLFVIVQDFPSDDVPAPEDVAPSSGDAEPEDQSVLRAEPYIPPSTADGSLVQDVQAALPGAEGGISE